MELVSKFKRSLIYLLVASPATLALAQPMGGTPCCFNNFTVGLGIGATAFMAQINIDPVAGTTTLEAGKKVYDYSEMGALYIGYGNVFGNFYNTYLGAELGVNVFGAWQAKLSATEDIDVKTSATTITGQDDLSGYANYANSLSATTEVTRNKWEPFLDIKAGFLVTPTAIVYLKGGIAYNNLKVKSNSSYNVTGFNVNTSSIADPFVKVKSVSTDSALNTSKSKNVLAWRAGIGTEYLVTPDFGIGADYVYTFYGTLNTSGNGVANDVACDVFEGCAAELASYSSASKTTIADQQVLAQLIYHYS